MTIAIEVTGFRLSDSSVQTLRFSDDGFMTLPSDTPANVYYEPRLSAPPHFARSLFNTAQASFGASQSTPGEIVLENSDGGIDYLLTDYAFDGRPFTMRVGTLGTPFAQWTVTASGTLSDVKVSNTTTLSLVVNDRQKMLALTQQRPTYGGTNVLPNGIDGTPNDLMGQYVPRVYGQVMNVAPKCANTSLLIYQASDQSNCTITAVYDNGVALTLDAPYPDLATLKSTAPSAGHARAFQGRFRLGSSPASQVTCDATSGVTSAASLMQQIALDAGFTAGDISAADVAALNALTSAPCGVWADGQVTSLSLMDTIALSIGAFYSFDRLGVLRMGRVSAPSGSPAVTLDDVVLEAVNIREAGIPVYQVTVNYAKNYTVQSQPAGSVSVDRRTWLSQASRSQVAKSATVQTTWPSATDQTFDTALINAADATAEANRRLALFSRRMLMTVDIDLSQLGTLDLGSVVGFTYPRYGLPSKLMTVVGVDAGADTHLATLTLWG
ncbi:hypothetical protein J8I87_05995 [Paraburkholderia sp. LEh10]|uniref:hypothetical protein n=1 Tax=Paraburkholderia sp. LEh10 TaxID=2821353 RepID=UPI001AE85B54|nr:hypothetical protein [Paraburkholderia sp. LEh10]MBP0589275.1 hypothetical protein [Paraburkholderia sp. LEh10]